jgi:hypothetical protein
MALNPYRFRVFLSYSHSDKPLIEKMATILESIGLRPLWDVDINAGKPFTDEIKELIARSHLFVPIITENSHDRPWVHQETGFAIALNIPILPITIGSQPSEMISAIQAITVKSDLTDLAEKVREINLDQLILPSPQKPFRAIEVAEWAEQRADIIVQYANWVKEIEGYLPLRLQARFTVFGIPDVDTRDPIWDEREGGDPRSPYLRHLLREERRILESHARAAGCKLIIDPTADPVPAQGIKAKRPRLEILSAFIQSMTDDNLQVVFSERARDKNLLIMGDYFVAEAVAFRSGGYVQTIFNSHPPAVLQRIRQYDRLFDELYAQNPMTVKDAVQRIEGILAEG